VLQLLLLLLVCKQVIERKRRAALRGLLHDVAECLLLLIDLFVCVCVCVCVLSVVTAADAADLPLLVPADSAGKPRLKEHLSGALPYWQNTVAAV
jgi:hypothetical protein